MGALRVVTFNICSGRVNPAAPPDPGGRRLAAAVQALDADVLALQEVDREQPRSAGQDQAGLAAAAMGCRPGDWRFAATLNGTPGEAWTPARRGVAGPAYGVALLSRLPVQEWAEIALPAAPVRSPVLVGDARGRPRILALRDEPRIALVAVVEGADGPMTVVCTHLSFVPGWNAWQLRRLRSAVRHFPRPLVLAGDLNLPGRIPSRLTGWRGAATGATFPADRPRVQLDHVLIDGLPAVGWNAVTGTLLRPPLSDHLAMAVDMSLDTGTDSHTARRR